MNQTEEMELSNSCSKDRKDVAQKIKNMRLLDDNLMNLVFHENIPAVQLILRIILEKPDLVVTAVRTEDEHLAVSKRSVRLDVRAVDSNGVIYDIEVQRADHGAGVRRARYNSSLIDARLLEVGEKNFNKLPDKYVIFITEKDFMKEGRAVYSYIMMEQTTHKPLGDGTHIVYVNGAYENNESDIGKLMHDFRCKDPSEMNFETLARDVDYFKNGGGQSQMCKIVEELCKEAKDEGVVEGREQGREETLLEQNTKYVLKMHKQGKTVKEIADFVEIDEQEVCQILESNKDLTEKN